MAQWLLCPDWEGRRHSTRDDIGLETHQRHIITFVRVTNPTPYEGRFSMLIHEERGDGVFYEAEYNSGTYTVPAMYQHRFLIDPGFDGKDRWKTNGWIEFWLSLDAMLIDVSILGLTRNWIIITGFGGRSFVQTRSTRTATLVPMRPPFLNRVIEWIMPSPPLPRHFQRGGEIIPLDPLFEEPYAPPMEEG